jgi:hypothetical protein
MRTLMMLTAFCVALGLGACASQEREWMKVDESFTVAEFRRDYASCSKGAALDEACMRSRGWVAVSPGGKVEKPPEPARPSGPTGITTR